MTSARGQAPEIFFAVDADAGCIGLHVAFADHKHGVDFHLLGALNFAVDLVGAFVEFRADLISAQFVQNRLRFVSKASIRSQIFVQACLHRESTSASESYGIELRFELFRPVTSLTSDVRGSTAKSRRWVAFIAAEVTTIHRTVRKAAQTTSFLLKTFIAKRFPPLNAYLAVPLL